jgi:hypothetical protein
MTGLAIIMHAPEDFVKSAVHMEDNYPGIIRSAVWNKVIFPYRLLGGIASIIQKPLITKKYFRLVESFCNKVKNPREHHYIDMVAEKEGITVPKEIKPFNEKSYKFRGDLAYVGIEFELAEKKSLEYLITHGTS